jgi:hypothetical protein
MADSVGGQVAAEAASQGRKTRSSWNREQCTLLFKEARLGGFIEALLSHKYNTGIRETDGDPSSEGEERKGEAL